MRKACARPQPPAWLGVVLVAEMLLLGSIVWLALDGLLAFLLACS